MPTYVYEYCNGELAEKVVPIADRDNEVCPDCGMRAKRKVAFTGLTWAPTAGGMR